MKSDTDQTQSQDTAAAAAPARLASPTRRRLLRGGMIGAPALLALKSTPVMACNCKLPSGFSLSGNLSVNKGAACAAPGYTPGYWSTNCDSAGKYKNTTCYKTDNLSKYFSCNANYPDKTLDACLQVGKTNPRDTQAMALACYLQSFTDGGTRFPMPAVVREIWNQGVIANRYVSPGTNAVWTRTHSVKYFRYLTGQYL